MPEGQHIMGTGRKRERNWQEELVRRGEREEKVSWKREKKRVSKNTCDSMVVFVLAVFLCAFCPFMGRNC